jgi:hypothetical protein
MEIFASVGFLRVRHDNVVKNSARLARSLRLLAVPL